MWDIYVTGPTVDSRLELLKIAKELKVPKPTILEGGHTFYWLSDAPHQVEAKAIAREYKSVYGGQVRTKEGNVFTSLL